MRRSSIKANKVSQTVKGLTPGRMSLREGSRAVKLAGV